MGTQQQGVPLDNNTVSRAREIALDLPALPPRLHLAALPLLHPLGLLGHEIRVRRGLLRWDVLLLLNWNADGKAEEAPE